jgi:hypothetical protein
MNNKFRFHVLGLPHTVSSKEFNACAYTQKIVKFGKMMTDRGHTVIHYGHEDSELICTEHVPVLTNEDFEIAYGNYDWRKNFFTYDMGDHAIASRTGMMWSSPTTLIPKTLNSKKRNKIISCSWAVFIQAKV